MHEHVHDENCRQPRTAAEEASVRIVNNLDLAEKELSNVPWYKFKLRYQLLGYMAGLLSALALLDRLNHKYDNERGTLN